MSLSFLLVALLSVGPHGGTGATACWTSCQRHVQDAATRAKVCRVCLTHGGVDAWLEPLAELTPPDPEALRSALTDGDWRVRLAAVRAEARVRGVPERQALVEWVASVPASAELSACVTAIRAAAEAQLPLEAYLKGGGVQVPAASARLRARRDAIREALEVELYAQKASERGPALAHLAHFLRRPPARVVLDAMASRPASADEAVARALREVAERERVSVGRMLLEVAKPADEARVNRLFAVYSRELEALRPELTAMDAGKRRVAVLSLRRYGPLARAELSAALKDPDRQVRQSAARGLAEAQGLSLVEAARAALSPQAEPALQRPWLEGVTREEGGAALLLSVVDNRSQPPEVRGEAVYLLGECEDGTRLQRFERLAPFLRDGAVPVRAGAVRALGVLGWGPESTEAVVSALEDPAPEVQVAALQVLGERRQTSRADLVAERLHSESPEVRAAAARALGALGRASQHTRPLAKCLKADAVAAVRAAAAQSLGALGGPQAAGALSEALQKDPDTHVQHVAREALGRLGFSR